MTEQIEGLLRILGRQLLKYKELLEVARGLQKALIDNDIDAFEDFLKKEHLLLAEVGKLEEERLLILQDLANRFCISPRELTISKLVQLADQEYKAPLTEIQETMTRVMNVLKEVNASNADLLRHAMEYISFSFNVLTGLTNQYNYTASGEEKDFDPKRAKIFDRKI